MKNITLDEPKIKGIQFSKNNTMLLNLDNDRKISIPLHKFKDIEQLTLEQREEFEIIDDYFLSFLAIDQVYSINDLMDFA
ncbi:MAG: hypothetical protein FVQ77_13815 [Cytophagales bacterium]|nr:hypothetical protein [Cytophagales bacterium]